MKRERQCPFCEVGRTRVRTSWRKGPVQVQKLECHCCGHRFTRVVSGEDIARRQKIPAEPCKLHEPRRSPPGEAGNI